MHVAIFFQKAPRRVAIFGAYTDKKTNTLQKKTDGGFYALVLTRVHKTAIIGVYTRKEVLHMGTANRTKRLAARITPSDVAAIDELARKLKMSKTAAVMWAVRYALSLSSAYEDGDTRGEEEGAN